MLLIYLISSLAAVGCFWLGQSGRIRLDRRSASHILRITLFLALLMTMFQFAYTSDWAPYELPSGLMSGIYGGVSGLIGGMTLYLFRQKTEAGEILYTPRSFWSDHGLDGAALLLILFGLYRSTLFQDLPVTPLRITSGMSLIALGVYSWVLRPVPELRRMGLLFLDRLIPVAALLSARWEEEQVLAVDYQEEEEPIRTLRLQTPDPAERKDADRAISRLLELAREIREEKRKSGISA